MTNTALSAKLKNPDLLVTEALVGGAWVSVAQAGKSFDVLNPSTGEIIATLPDLGVEETRAAIDAAYVAQKDWAKKTGKERSAVMRKFHDLMVANVDDLGAILTAEMGKPLAEGKGEILYGASFIEWFAEEAKRVYGDTIPGHQADKRIVVIKQPVGVVASITPWNFPNAMIARKLGPALAVGCAFVAKPAAETPLSALVMAKLAEQAGVPKGLFSVITSKSSAAIGQEFCSNDKVRKLTFTGSTEVGRILMRQSADQIKKTSMELGGNAPFIVFDDADLDAAADNLIANKFRGGGQTCVCANRIFVHEKVADAFGEKLAERVNKMTVGDGINGDVDLGPLINQAGYDKVKRHVQDALEKGATLVAGKKPEDLGNDLFFPPTVVHGVNREMSCYQEETFGPLVPMALFRTEEEVIEAGNDTEFGLASYVFTNDAERAQRVAAGLRFGHCGWNTGTGPTPEAPFGGMKASGIGREGGLEGLFEFVEAQTVPRGF